MDTITYNGKPYTNKTIEQMPSKDLVALHNELAAKVNGTPTKRFASLGAGWKRTWALLEQVGEQDAQPEGGSKAKLKTSPTASIGGNAPAAGQVEKAPPAATPKRRASDTAAVRRGTNLAAPGFSPKPCREGSKQAVLLDKLRASNGATMAELLEATKFGNKPWTEASVRSGFGWDMKQKGYGVRSEFVDGVERFFIVLPVGGVIPPHTPLKAAPKADARQAKLDTTPAAAATATA